MQTSEKRLEEQIHEISQLARENKEVDAAALMLRALETHERNMLPASQKRFGYFVSIGFPPLGLLFALKFWFSGTDDGEQAAIACIILTVVSLVLLWVTLSSIFSGGTAEQLQQINPQDVLELTQ